MDRRSPVRLSSSGEFEGVVIGNAQGMPMFLYQVNFNNGESEVEPSLDEAHDLAVRRTSDETEPELAPVEIWEVAKKDGVGRIVEVLGTDGKVTRVAALR